VNQTITPASINSGFLSGFMRWRYSLSAPSKPSKIDFPLRTLLFRLLSPLGKSVSKLALVQMAAMLAVYTSGQGMLS